jgi:hypothetical protein
MIRAGMTGVNLCGPRATPLRLTPEWAAGSLRGERRAPRHGPDRMRIQSCP